MPITRATEIEDPTLDGRRRVGRRVARKGPALTYQERQPSKEHVMSRMHRGLRSTLPGLVATMLVNALVPMAWAAPFSWRAASPGSRHRERGFDPASPEDGGL